jgi:hypothetical protein
MNPDRMTGTISITVLPQENGQYVCSLSSSLSDRMRDDTRFYGQTKEHAIAIALENLADQYRQIAQKSQDRDWLAVERSDSGDPIEKRYHVILHYERIAEAESKFEAMQDTMMGNTVVENANLSVIEIAPDLQVNPLARSWN